jgi:hypothetical protein
MKIAQPSYLQGPSAGFPAPWGGVRRKLPPQGRDSPPQGREFRPPGEDFPPQGWEIPPPGRTPPPGVGNPALGPYRKSDVIDFATIMSPMPDSNAITRVLKQPVGMALKLVYRAEHRCKWSGAPAGAFPKPLRGRVGPVSSPKSTISGPSPPKKQKTTF